jgi:AcrR family transcriptional regulator
LSQRGRRLAEIEPGALTAERVMPDPAAGQKLPPGRHGLEPELVAAIQRERLLAAMIAVVGEDGFDQISVQDVLDRAEVSRLTYYEHFKNRRDCFLVAYDTAVERLSARMVRAGAEGAGWREQLRLGLAELLRFLGEEPRTARALLVEVHAAGAVALEHRDAPMKRAARFIDRGRQEPGGGTPPPVTAESVVGGIHGLLHSRLIADPGHDFTRLLPTLMHFAVLPYLGQAAAQAELGRR